MTPAAPGNDAIDRAVGESELARERNLFLSSVCAATDLADSAVADATRPSTGLNRFANVLPMCGPLEVIGTVVPRIMVNVANVGQAIRIRNEGFSNQPVNQYFSHLSVRVETDVHPRALPAARSVDVLGHDSSGGFVSPSESLPANPAHSSGVADLIKPLIAGDGFPVLTHDFTHVIVDDFMVCNVYNNPVKENAGENQWA